MSGSALRLFEGFGVELEYMIVDRSSLAVRPIADRLLEAAAGELVSEVEAGELAWSNELVLHVVELKTNGPAPSLEGLPPLFARDVRRVGELLEALGARLMPTAMHPWMDPERETRLWPHEHSPIYQAYDRIFGCRGHGWSNLQSAHLNLPFADDAEFGRLHAGARLLLPLLPALAASSPVVEGRLTGLLDNRMDLYRTNSSKVPSVAGEIVPEPIYSRHKYEREILEPAYRDVAPWDPEGVLRGEFLNSRGAIAHFSRGSLEIRVVDLQECPRADLAIAALAAGVLRLLAAETWAPLAVQQSVPVAPLAELLRRSLRDAEATVVDDPRYLEAFGLSGRERTSAGEVWHHLAAQVFRRGAAEEASWRPTLEPILKHGTLARRIVRALGRSPSRERLAEVYGELCACLEEDRLFGLVQK